MKARPGGSEVFTDKKNGTMWCRVPEKINRSACSPG